MCRVVPCASGSAVCLGSAVCIPPSAVYDNSQARFSSKFTILGNFFIVTDVPSHSLTADRCFSSHAHIGTHLTHTLIVRTFSILLYSPGLCTLTYPQVTSSLFSEIFISTLRVATPFFYQVVCQIKDSRLFHRCSEVGLKMCSSHDIERLQS